MPPIPIYNNSPVAAKPEGVAPQTVSGGGEKAAAAQGTGAATTKTTSASYPRAQPGAAPALPVPTGTAQAPAAAAPLQPTATQPLRSTEGPPPPQPGTAPTPARTGGSSLPPPPKAGEKFVPPPPATTSAAPVPYPQQMSISPPTMAYPAQQHGTATATAPPSLYGQTSGATGSNSSSSSNSNNNNSYSYYGLDHPPGYHQNANASELDQYHQQAALGRNDSAGARADAAGEEGLWGAAKKLAQGAGEKLVTAESEVWKRINKQ